MEKKPLRRPHAPGAAAGGAGLGLRARLRAGTGARLAGDGGRDLEFGGLAVEGLVEGDLEVVAHVGAALAPAGAPTAPAASGGIAEEILEDVRHEVGEVAAEARPCTARSAIGEGRMAEAVVGRALLAVGEGLVGLVEFLELDLRLVIARVAVRMILHRELAEGGFHLRIGRGLRDAENLVVIALRHIRRPSERLAAPSCRRSVSIASLASSPPRSSADTHAGEKGAACRRRGGPRHL